MSEKPVTTNLSTDRITYLRDQFTQLDGAQPMTYAIELRILRDDILTALDMAWQYEVEREAQN